MSVPPSLLVPEALCMAYLDPHQSLLDSWPVPCQPSSNDLRPDPLPTPLSSVAVYSVPCQAALLHPLTVLHITATIHVIKQAAAAAGLDDQHPTACAQLHTENVLRCDSCRPSVVEKLQTTCACCFACLLTMQHTLATLFCLCQVAGMAYRSAERAVKVCKGEVGAMLATGLCG